MHVLFLSDDKSLHDKPTLFALAENAEEYAKENA